MRQGSLFSRLQGIRRVGTQLLVAGANFVCSNEQETLQLLASTPRSFQLFRGMCRQVQQWLHHQMEFLLGVRSLRKVQRLKQLGQIAKDRQNSCMKLQKKLFHRS